MLEIKTIINGNSRRIFFEFQTRKNIPLLIISSILLLLSGGLLLILESYISGIVLIIFAIIFAPALFFISKKTQNKIVNSNPITQELANTIRFEQTYVFVETLRDNRLYTAKFNYADFYKCFETAEHIFLYLKKKVVLIIPYDDIVIGSKEELTKMLKSKLKAKYKKLKLKISNIAE